MPELMNPDFHPNTSSNAGGSNAQTLGLNLRDLGFEPDYATPVEKCPALVLNADFRPLSYFPLSLWSWQDTVKAAFQDRVNVVAEYDRVIRSPEVEMRLPSVIALKDYIPMSRSPAFTRFNVFLRDRFSCQYCGVKHRTQDLTFDHVIPRASGGRTNWQNVVAACQRCNRIKGHKSLKEVGFKLKHEAREPSVYALQEIGRAYPPNYLHESWQDYLYWDAELEAQHTLS